MLLYISVYHEFIKLVIAFWRLSRGLLKLTELALQQQQSIFHTFSHIALTLPCGRQVVSASWKSILDIFYHYCSATSGYFGSFGKSPENNRAFYEFMMYRNVRKHGDSRQKKIIMKTTNNVNENQRNIFLSCCWKLDALQNSIYLKLQYYVEYGLILLRNMF